MEIIIDRREQKPFAFEGEAYPNTTTSPGTLAVGDYSVRGLENAVAIERKSLSDLIGCLGVGRDRFKREIMRGRGLEFFAVVVEGRWRDLVKGKYKSKLTPQSAVQSVASFMARTRTPFFFSETRLGAEHITWSLLRQYIQGKSYEWQAVAKAMEEPLTA